MNVFTFKLDTKSEKPLYRQLYEFVVSEIEGGRLSEGEKLPSKRSLCAHLKISQSTVETAYSILVAEGYIESRPKSGYYALAIERLSRGDFAENEDPLPYKAHGGEKDQTARRAPRFDFSTNAVDTSAFPYASWAKIFKETVYQNPELLQRGDARGDAGLRRALAGFLHEYRGVSCSEGQIVIGAGMEYLLDMLLQILGDKAVFAVEDPGYVSTIRTIENNGRAVVPIPVDRSGMDVLKLLDSQATVAYVTPSHQFPMGVTMPIGRRTALLNWAAEKRERYIIEDDYDSEFRYSSRPIAAMQGLDKNGKVIYIGTFSRGIAPSIRAAYMVLPERLISEYERLFSHSSSTVSRFEQMTLCRFIESGLYARHLRRMTNIYKKRVAHLTSALLSRIPGAAVIGAFAGLHFILTLPGIDEKSLVSLAKDAGIDNIHGLREYGGGAFLEGAPGVVLGFAGLRDGEVEDAAMALCKAWGFD